MSVAWNHNNQEEWKDKFPTAAGLRQSPIDITKSAVKCAKYPPLMLESNTDGADDVIVIENNTHTISWSQCQNAEPRPVKTLTGGPLKYRYKFDHCHVHWGTCHGEGSEHTLDGERFDAEIHYVFKREVSEGVDDDEDPVAVLGIWLSQSDDENPCLTEMAKSLAHVVKCCKLTCADKFDLMSLLPMTDDYYTYLGSLTTPPFNEVVRHFLFKNPIGISEDTLKSFREVCDENDKCIAFNYRKELCPLNERVVESVKQ